MKFVKLMLPSLWAGYLGAILSHYGHNLNTSGFWIIVIPTAVLNVIGTDLASRIKDK